MNSLVVAVQFDSDAQLSEDMEQNHDTNKKLELASRIIHALLARGQSKILATIKGMIYADMPVNNIEILKDLVESLKEKLNIDVHIGVAEDSRMATLAAKFANAHNKHIHVFDYDVEEFGKSESSNKSETLQKSQKDDIYDAIKIIHFNKDLFAALKEHNPEMYKSIVDIVNALSNIYSQDKEQNEQVKQSELQINNLIKDEATDGPRDPVKFNDLVDDVDDGTKNNASDKSGSNGDGSDEHTPLHDDKEHKEDDQALPKPQLTDESKKQLVGILQSLEDNQDTLAEIKQAKPEVADAIDQLAGALYEIFTNAAGNTPEEEDHKGQVNDALASAKPKTAEKETNHKVKYQPGAIRVGQDNKARQKGADGQWRAVGGTAKPLG